MKINCKWLPEENEIDINNIEEEVEEAYKIFKEDFIESDILLNGFKVAVRRYPEDDIKGRYYSFNHITTKDYDKKQGNSNEYEDRYPDIRRLERIAWIKKLIEHPNCVPTEECNCKGNLLWYEEYKNTYRVNIMLYDEDFFVVLEKHPNKPIYLLITAFYFENEIEKNKRYKKYKKDSENPYIPEDIKKQKTESK